MNHYETNIVNYFNKNKQIKKKRRTQWNIERYFLKDYKTGHSDMLRNQAGTVDVTHYKCSEIICEVK